MMRGGYMKSVGNGIFTLSPVTRRITAKIEAIIREEMNRIGGQEVLFPVAMPAALWRESGRYESVGSELVRFKDRSGADMVLGMTHEEASVHYARDLADSYTQYPFMIYQIQTKFRDEPRCRGGLIRVREFTMKDAYSFHTSQEDLARYYDICYEAYNCIRPRGLAGSRGRGFGQRHDGRQSFARIHAAHARGRGHHRALPRLRLPRQHGGRALHHAQRAHRARRAQKGRTPGVKTIEDLCAFLGIPATATCKAVVYQENLTDKYIVAFLRGDLDINETKLRNFVKAEIHPGEITPESGLCAGFIGPLGLPKDVRVVFDASLQGGGYYATGANETDAHFTGFNIERDLGAVEYVDVAKAYDGGICPSCGKPSIYTARGIEVGNIFQLGTKYTESMNMTYVDADGSLKHPIMGCYGIGVGRLAASACEAHHDEYGPIWPISIAPWQVHICSLRPDDAQVAEVSQNLYDELNRRGIEVIWDDRPVSAGVMFSDADLLGVPVRAVVSPKNLKNGAVEISLRDKSLRESKPIAEAADFLYNLVKTELEKLDCHL